MNKLKIIAGPLLGFSTFLLGTIKTGGVYYRPNEKGKLVFSTKGLRGYMKAPFMVGTPQFRTVWGLYKGLPLKDRLKMLQLNWVAMVGIGSLVSIVAFLY